MEAVCWKFDLQKPVYRIQFDKVDKRSKNKIERAMEENGWSLSGDSNSINNYSILFTKEFNTTQELIKWAKGFEMCTIFLEKANEKIVQLNNKKRGRPKKHGQKTN